MGNLEICLVEFHARCYNVLKQVLTLLGWYQWRCRSSHQLNIYQRAELNDDEDDIGLNGIVIEKGNIQKYKAEQIRGGKSWLSSFLGRLFSNSRLPVVRRQGTEGRICCSMIARFIVGSFTKTRRVLRYWRRQHYSRRPTWREFWWSLHFNHFNLLSLYPCKEFFNSTCFG